METVAELEHQIEELSFEIRDKQIELKTLKAKRDAIKKPMDTASKIHRFERMYPGGVKATFDRLVRKGETFDEWYERHGQYCRGNRIVGVDWTRRHYEDCKKPPNNYVSWLIEMDDPRIRDTEAYHLA